MHARPARWRHLLGLIACACCVIAGASACTAAPTPTPAATALQTGILLVAPGEQVQAGPPTEDLKVESSSALALAQANGNDLGYPWYDAATGELVLSAVTPRGLQLIAGAGIVARHRIRTVAHGTAELQRIQDEATFLGGQGVPGAELIYATVPDWRDNRAMIVISAPSQPLLDALIARWPADALAVQVKPRT